MHSLPAPRSSLGHIRVLDLTRVLAGPWCAQNLVDLGADVIKVERPGAGDDTRAWGPPYLRDADGVNTTEAAYYLAANRGKRSITVDITTPEGRQIYLTNSWAALSRVACRREPPMIRDNTQALPCRRRR
jgi:formyl-CoA transferase